MQILLWRLHLALASHPGHSAILLRSQGPSGKRENLNTVAASNSRDLTPRLEWHDLRHKKTAIFEECESDV